MATPDPASRLTLGAVAAGGDGLLVLGYCQELDDRAMAGDPEAEPASHIMRLEQGRLSLVARHPWRLETLCGLADGSILGVGRAMASVRIRAGDLERLPDVHPGTCTGLWAAPGGGVHLVGMHASFWRCRGPDGWVDLPPPAGTPGLSAVAGMAVDDVYAVGMRGTVLRWDGSHVIAQAVPADVWLTAAVALPGGICIGGQRGVLLYGHGDGWRRIDSGTGSPIRSLAVRDGGVCIATPEGVRWIDPERDVRRLISDLPCSWVASAGDGILLVHGELAWLYDGDGIRPVDTAL